MGGSCSTTKGRRVPASSCGSLDGFECGEEACHLCEEEDKGPFQAHEHPLLQGALAGDNRPPSPRGPAPPWAVTASASRGPIDRTATGATPPRSPVQPRTAPPGLPEEEALASSPMAATLFAAFEAKFSKDLFIAARSGRAAAVTDLLHQLNTAALAQVCKLEPVDETDTAAFSERCERATEVASMFLSKVREAPPAGGTASPLGRDTLLAAACSKANLEVVRVLLNAKADPVSTSEDVMSPLHRAAQSGSTLCALMVLDRLQAGCRSVCVSDLANSDGETPITLACTAGASEMVRALEIFGEMQADAESRQLGSSHVSGVAEGGLRGSLGTGDMLTFIDLAAEARSSAGQLASSLLRRSALGSRLARNMFARIPDDEAMMQATVERACEGIKAAEVFLLSTPWEPSEPTLDPAVRCFVITAQLRARWQTMRADAVRSEAGALSVPLDDFWQTHLTAVSMVSTIRGATGDTWQLLLTVLWLYTREAWLRHILDALSATLHSVSHTASSSGWSTSGDGATGATPSWPSDLPGALRVVAPLFDQLAPFVELVQSALCWFEEAGIRHSAVTYRPLSLPMLGLQRLVDKYIALRKSASEAQVPSGREQAVAAESEAGKPLGGGAWLSLGAGSFFSSMSSRSEAIRRLTKCRCNAIVFLKPDDDVPCFPKHMMLRGSNVDDTVFPLDAIFRISRITRIVSSELDTEHGPRTGGPSARWPVLIIEVSASSRFLEVLELLERRGDLGHGEAERRVEDWVAGTPRGEEFERLVTGGETLGKLCRSQKAGGKESWSWPFKPGAPHSKRGEKALELLNRALAIAEASSDAEGVARALLARARCGGASGDSDGRRAIRLLEESLGASHPTTSAARAAWHELGHVV